MWLLVVAGVVVFVAASRRSSTPATRPFRPVSFPGAPAATGPSAACASLPEPARSQCIKVTSDPCSLVPDGAARETCRKVVSGQPPEVIAQYLAAYGGTVACVAYGAGALAPLCGQAAATVAGWLFDGYTPAEVAHHLFEMARRDWAYLFCFPANAGCPGKGWPQDRAYIANLRDNLKKIGLYKIWEAPDHTAAEQAILLVMTARGLAGKGPLWWVTKKRFA